jgi:hypothetical protein
MAQSRFLSLHTVELSRTNSAVVSVHREDRRDTIPSWLLEVAGGVGAASAAGSASSASGTSAASSASGTSAANDIVIPLFHLSDPSVQSPQKYERLNELHAAYGLPSFSLHVSQRNRRYIGKTMILGNGKYARVYPEGLPVTVKNLVCTLGAPCLLMTADPDTLICIEPLEYLHS